MVESSPDNHVGHLVSSAELLIVDSDDRDDPGNVQDKLLVGGVQTSEVVQSDGGLALSLSHLYPTLALSGRHIQMDYQVRLLPVNNEVKNIITILQTIRT